MAYSVIPRPGSRLGPCVPLCQHRDCLMLREQALWACRYCAQAIGYERAWTMADGEPAHMACAIDDVMGSDEED